MGGFGGSSRERSERIRRALRRLGKEGSWKESARKRPAPDRDEWVSFHAGFGPARPAPRPTAPHDLPGYNVVTHDLWLPNGGREWRAQSPDHGRFPPLFADAAENYSAARFSRNQNDTNQYCSNTCRKTQFVMLQCAVHKRLTST